MFKKSLLMSIQTLQKECNKKIQICQFWSFVNILVIIGATKRTLMRFKLNWKEDIHIFLFTYGMPSNSLKWERKKMH